MAQRRDSRGRFASGGGGGAARRNARRIASRSGAESGRAFEAQSRAMAGTRRVKSNGSGTDSRSTSAQRTQAASTYAAAVASRSMGIQYRRLESPSFVKSAKQSARDMTAKQLAKSQKLAKQNPTSVKLKEGLQIARMAAAVGGSHPRQRVKRKRA